MHLSESSHLPGNQAGTGFGVCKSPLQVLPCFPRVDGTRSEHLRRCRVGFTSGALGAEDLPLTLSCFHQPYDLGELLHLRMPILPTYVRSDIASAAPSRAI